MQYLKFNLKPLSYFLYCLLFICASYLCFELYFIPHEILSADEFVFARHIYDYTQHFPYRDFAPYKTVLGYYLYSLPLFFSHAALQPLFYIKNEIAILNTLFIAVSGIWATRFFDKRAVLLTLLAVIANLHFLISASELRVDMLTSWFCLFAMLALLQHSYRLSGMLLGLAFLISQKALWYMVAINGAMLLCYTTFASSPFSLRTIIQFNLSLCAIIMIYIAGWSAVSSPTTVLYSLFYEGYIQSTISWYLPIYIVCWIAVLSAGPLLFLCWPLTGAVFFDKPLNEGTKQQALFITSMSSIALLLFINYKQAFPYNFVFTIPALFLLYANFLSWLMVQSKQMMRSLLITLFIIGGIIYPFFHSMNAAYRLDGSYQQTMIQLIDELTNDHSQYIGGIPYLYQKDQPITGMKNLIDPQVGYLFSPNQQTQTLLLPSIYLAATSSNLIIHELEQSSVKLFVMNYRILLLPDAIKQYLDDHYHHFYGSIYLYAPLIHPTNKIFSLKFSGDYKIDAALNMPITIDHQKVASGKIITLTKGIHYSKTSINYRLELIPTALPALNPLYQQDQWLNMTKAILA